MKTVHIVIPDLFLPKQLAAYASKDLRLPALEKLLARSQGTSLNIDSLESWLCQQFGVDELAIAPLMLQADGVKPQHYYCLRVDPVGISMQRDQMVLQANLALTMEESAQLCASLNTHFAADDLRFLAPHPQRWYLQLAYRPAIETHHLAQVVGADMHAHLPYGVDALRWHSVLNEIQMLFYDHAVNQSREQRGEAAVNGVWLWGGGKMTDKVLQPFARVLGDSELAGAFAQASGVPFTNDNVSKLPSYLKEGGDLLVVVEGLRTALQFADIDSWRNTVQQIEKNIVMPLLASLVSGRIGQITLDVLSEGASRRFVVRRSSMLKFWRFSKPLLHYALVPDSA